MLNRFLQRRPFLGNMLLSACIMGTGDILAQTVEKYKNGHNKDLNMTRSFIMGSYSAVAFTPVGVAVYGWIDRNMKAGTFLNIVKRGTVANLTTNPPLNLFFYVYSTSVAHMVANVESPEQLIQLIKGAHVPSLKLSELKEKCKQKLKSEYINTCLTSAAVWIPYASLNFALTPPHFRIIFSSIGSVFWSCYLSLSQHRKVEATPVAQPITLQAPLLEN
eukprot:snap_masked-scaffold_2-processed-gene-18.37-mRNA-1 protein AED:1.00 eAED:1.00 QI:0/-1/0/0/-1/1/1/0/218